jgi:predicted DNA-binding transcriptional regulator AlpA
LILAVTCDYILSMARKIYGIAEIAEELGVRRETVAQWHNRKQLPDPDEQLGMGPAWLAKTIRPWLEKKKAQIAAKALMSTNLGVIVWLLVFGGLIWASFTTLNLAPPALQ